MHIRNTRPILVADFWGDGPLTGGCLSGGRKYIHINNKGDVEPCIFAHFATDNIKEKSLIECLSSDFFKDLRNMAPFGKNLLLPCPLIDHPGVMKKAVERNGAYPTHDGALTMLNEMQPELHVYAKQVREALTPVWQETTWAHKWLESDPDYNKRLKRGADADVLAEEAGPAAADKVGARD